MKKSKFLNGIGAIFAFAVVFMTGSLVTSCEQEDLKATFEAGPAEVTLNVKVTDALTGADVTSQSTISVTGKLTATGKTSFATGFSGGDVTVRATYDGSTSTAQTLTLPALRVGGKASYSVNVIVDSEYEFVGVTTTTFTLGSALVDQTHSYNGSLWCLNDKEYLLERTIKYNVYDTQVATTDVTAIDLSDLVASMNYSKVPKVESQKFSFSAWSYYKVLYKRNKDITTYTVKRKGGTDTFGTLVVTKDKDYSIEPEEVGFNANYTPGHGHGVHGYDDNAGGGIIEAE